jgi:magnesium chelatase family protein
MLAKIYSPAFASFEGELIEIECDLANGLPGFITVGLADKSVDEARERVRSAIKNSGLLLPQKRITLNLAPAHLPKDGTGYDLGMALSILVASQQLEPEMLAGSLCLGELSLDGTLRAVKGAVLAAQLARDRGLTHLYVPAGNAAEASMIEGIKVIAATSLRELYYHLTGIHPLGVVQKTTKKASTASVPDINTPDFRYIYGQTQAKRVLEIAAAGGHNLLLTGPPGAGKTLLSRSLLRLLPIPSFDEQLEITKLHSLAGINQGQVVDQRPFRAPHHTASSAALIGGGTIPRPGEISLSHHGILFMDELPEFPRNVLEVLRQPLEDGRVTVARAARTSTFPARFMLVATRNPCPCGYHGSDRCRCKPYSVIQYQRRLSGPLIDRIDLILDILPVEREALIHQRPAESSATVARRVLSARRRQTKRYQESGISLNSQMDSQAIKAHCALDKACQEVADHAIQQLGLSARSYNRVLKVSRTIADLAGSTHISLPHLSEALLYRART